MRPIALLIQEPALAIGAKTLSVADGVRSSALCGSGKGRPHHLRSRGDERLYGVGDSDWPVRREVSRDRVQPAVPLIRKLNLRKLTSLRVSSSDQPVDRSPFSREAYRNVVARSPGSNVAAVLTPPKAAACGWPSPHLAAWRPRRTGPSAAGPPTRWDRRLPSWPHATGWN